MMKLISLLFLIFCLTETQHVLAQQASQTYASAIAEEQAGKYRDALDKYDRIMYFRHDTLQTEINIHAGNCAMFSADYYRALKYYDNALLADFRHEHQNEIQVQKLKAEVLAYNMRLAAFTMKDIDTVNDNAARREVYFYSGIIYFYLGEYGKSETNWLKLVSDDPVRTRKMDSLFRRNDRINHLKPGIAIALSIVLPGAGQIYAGDFKDGLNSLAITGIFFYLGYQTAVVYNVFNAVVAAGPWYLRYYEGGFLKAGEIVTAKRAARHAAIYSEILKLLH